MENPKSPSIITECTIIIYRPCGFSSSRAALRCRVQSPLSMKYRQKKARPRIIPWPSNGHRRNRFPIIFSSRSGSRHRSPRAPCNGCFAATGCRVLCSVYVGTHRRRSAPGHYCATTTTHVMTSPEARRAACTVRYLSVARRKSLWAGIFPAPCRGKARSWLICSNPTTGFGICCDFCRGCNRNALLDPARGLAHSPCA